MSDEGGPDPDVTEAIEAIYRRDATRVRATLIRLVGGFDDAEEALHEAFVAATAQWPREGVPANPVAWLVSAGRFKIVDRKRRQGRLAGAMRELAAIEDHPGAAAEPVMPDSIRDDELRLIFTCCHPALAPDARIALTLREVAGLTTEAIARAYLMNAPTIAQRIVRAKAKIRDDRIPYEVPAGADLAARIESVLRVVYLVFNEGYAAATGERPIRDELSDEAIRLARRLGELVDDPEALGLLALMLLHRSRRDARIDASGELVLLDQQDRTRWDRAQIGEARDLLERAFGTRRVGPYQLQAAIALAHAEAESTSKTDWTQIVGLYDVLRRVDPSPVVALNRAAAIAMRDGLERGLAEIDRVMQEGGLDRYPYAHAARAEVLRRLGRGDEAQASYVRAIAVTEQTTERRRLEARLAELRRTARDVASEAELGE